MISFLCVLWLLYHIIAEQCCIWRAQHQGYKKVTKKKKKQEEYNRLQRERNKQKVLSDKLTCENSAIDN